MTLIFDTNWGRGMEEEVLKGYLEKEFFSPSTYQTFAICFIWNCCQLAKMLNLKIKPCPQF